MASITAADVTVTLNPEDIDRSPDGRIGIRTFPVVQFGDGVTQYVALGVPMPALGKFGFHFAIKRAYIEQPGNGFVYSFDRANHKVRIWLGAAQAALTVAVANHIDLAIGAPTVANHIDLAIGAPTVANHIDLAIGAPTVANHIDLAIAAPANHSHGLVIASGNAIVDAVGINGTQLVAAANGTTIPGNVAANGGVADGAVPAPANMANLIHSIGAPANMANLQHSIGAPANMANLQHSIGAPANMANLQHSVTVTGGGLVAEAALAEMDAAVVLAASTHILYMEMVGR